MKGPAGWSRVMPSAVVAALLVSACGGPGVEHEGDPALTAELRISPTPPMVGAADILVNARDGGMPLDGAGAVTATPLPPNGEPGTATTLQLRDGGSWVGVVEFSTPGAQRVEISLTSPDGREARLRFPVQVTSAPGPRTTEAPSG